MWSSLIASRFAALVLSLALLAGLTSACSRQPPPEMPPDFLEVRAYDGAEPVLLVTYRSKESLLFGPHFGLLPHWTATWESLSAEDAQRLGFDAPDGFRAAEGHEFVAMHIGSTQLDQGRWPDDTDHPKLTASLTIGNRTEELATFPGPGTLIVASVPKSAPVKLTITDMGHEFSLDMRTAKPHRDGYKIVSATVDEWYEAGGAVATPLGPASLSVSFIIDEVSREPYLPDLGWAKPGRNWLRVRLSQLKSTAQLRSTAG